MNKMFLGLVMPGIKIHNIRDLFYSIHDFIGFNLFHRIYIHEWHGICDSCGVDFYRKTTRIGYRYEDNEIYEVFSVGEPILCETCHRQVFFIRIYKNLNVTNEFNNLVERSK